MIISSYFGVEQYEDRIAHVCKDDKGFYVDLYYQDAWLEKRELYDHSERYAEDCAENFVLGIFDVDRKVQAVDG
jgi:hypothetical protein